jgi:hypothetical protein
MVAADWLILEGRIEIKMIRRHGDRSWQEDIKLKC